MLDLSVIIPIYNEVGSVDRLGQRLTEQLALFEGIGKSYEVIFINDGSTDGSREALDRLAANPKFKVIHFRRNFGQTAAMMAGFDHASGKVIVPIDGDMQNDPADIARVVAKLDEGFDVCSGWRKDRKDNPIKRNFLSRVANRIISLASGVHLRDYGCSLKAYKSEYIKGVRLYGEMHRFIPIYASWQGARITEIPVLHHPRTEGVSKYGLDRTIKVLLDLMVVKFLASYAQRPIYVFGGVAAISFFLAFVASVFSVILKYFYETSFIRTPLPLLAVMLVILGAMCILMGLLAEVMMRTYYEAQGKSIYLVSDKKNF